LAGQVWAAAGALKASVNNPSRAATTLQRIQAARENDNAMGVSF
jgi:hypothetical protein